MLAHLVEASSRAFGMLAAIVMWLWSANRVFPSNWWVLGILYVALIPVALLYRRLTEYQPKPGVPQRFFPVPKHVVIGIGATIAIIVYFSYDTQIDAVLYSNAQ
jgi:hypothetical protein